MTYRPIDNGIDIPPPPAGWINPHVGPASRNWRPLLAALACVVALTAAAVVIVGRWLV